MVVSFLDWVNRNRTIADNGVDNPKEIKRLTIP